MAKAIHGEHWRVAYTGFSSWEARNDGADISIRAYSQEAALNVVGVLNAYCAIIRQMQEMSDRAITAVLEFSVDAANDRIREAAYRRSVN